MTRPWLLGRGLRWPRRFRRSEDGFLTIEFMIWFPVFLFVFLATVEAAILFTRITMLERALNVVVREVRIGALAPMTHDGMRDRLCTVAVAFPECATSLRVELTRVDMATFQGVTDAPDCIDRAEPIIVDDAPQDGGGSNELMMVRACMVVDPLFPTTGFGLRLPKDPTGGVRIISTSTFVNEPRGT